MATLAGKGVEHERHLFHALLMLTWGSMFFEQVYRYDDSAKRFRFRKLAPRMPGSISGIQVACDGGIGVHPTIPVRPGRFGARTSLVGVQSPKIPVDRLVAYVNDQEAGGEPPGVAKASEDTRYAK
jgi:hypothetical protein